MLFTNCNVIITVTLTRYEDTYIRKPKQRKQEQNTGNEETGTTELKVKISGT